MDPASIRAHISLSDFIRTPELSANFIGDVLPAPTYLWTVFFKIDGDTVSLGQDFMVHGTATVAATPGNHGDVPGIATKVALQGGVTFIPSQIGEFRTVLTPIPLPFEIQGVKSVGAGQMGCVAILLQEHDTPADAVASGHEALNSSLQHELDSAIASLGFPPDPNKIDVKAIQDRVGTAVHDAIKNRLSILDKIATFLGFEGQDSQVGTGLFSFSRDDLVASGPHGIPLEANLGTVPLLFPAGLGSCRLTVRGTLIVDPFPLSVRRVLARLDRDPSLGIRKPVTGVGKSSARAWIDGAW